MVCANTERTSHFGIFQSAGPHVHSCWRLPGPRLYIIANRATTKQRFLAVQHALEFHTYRMYTTPLFACEFDMSMPPHFDELIQACTVGDLAHVLDLIPLTNPKWFESVAFLTAASYNHTEIVLALLPYSDPTANEDMALKFAIENKNTVLFDALFPLCTDPFATRLYVHSIFAYICVNWPEKMEVFKNTVIPQNQYDSALDLLCDTANKGGLAEITVPLRNVLKDVLDKTSSGAQKQAMKNLWPKNRELFDLLIDHNSPANFVHILEKCLEEDYTHAITLFKRCRAANVSLPMPLLSKFLEYAVGNLDWKMIPLMATPETWEHSKAIERVALCNNLDMYEYCVQYGATPTKESARISAKMGNKELATRQMTEGTTTPDVLHWICAWGWNDLLPHALDYTDKKDIDALHSERRFGREQSFEECDGMWFDSCVRNQNFDCLDQILSYVFKSPSRDDAGPKWLHQLACHFYSDPIFVDVLSKNLPTVEMDLIVKKALRSVHDSIHGWKVPEVVEVFLPYTSPKFRVQLFEDVVDICKKYPQNHQIQKVSIAIAQYIKNKDITLSTQWWWDIHQSKKLNAKLNKKLKILGVECAVKKI